jgi:hypothetical protein
MPGGEGIGIPWCRHRWGPGGLTPVGFWKAGILGSWGSGAPRRRHPVHTDAHLFPVQFSPVIACGLQCP